jgi:hypothetical protein
VKSWAKPLPTPTRLIPAQLRGCWSMPRGILVQECWRLLLRFSASTLTAAKRPRRDATNRIVTRKPKAVTLRTITSTHRGEMIEGTPGSAANRRRNERSDSGFSLTFLPLRLRARFLRTSTLFHPKHPCNAQRAGQHVLARLGEANVGRSHLSPPAMDRQKNFR